MVHVAMSNQNIFNLRILRFLQDTLRLSRRIDDRTFPRSGANEQVAIVFKRTNFKPIEFHSTLQVSLLLSIEHRAYGSIPSESFGFSFGPMP
jgi:hypothetical protein